MTDRLERVSAAALLVLLVPLWAGLTLWGVLMGFDDTVCVRSPDPCAHPAREIGSWGAVWSPTVVAVVTLVVTARRLSAERLTAVVPVVAGLAMVVAAVVFHRVFEHSLG